MVAPVGQQDSIFETRKLLQVACIMWGPWGPGGTRPRAVGAGGLRYLNLSGTSGQKFKRNVCASWGLEGRGTVAHRGWG